MINEEVYYWLLCENMCVRKYLRIETTQSNQVWILVNGLHSCLNLVLSFQKLCKNPYGDSILIFLVHVTFTSFNNGCMKFFVNITSCILLKQQSKGIILITIVFRCKLIEKNSTRINLLKGICNWRNGGTIAQYINNIKYINSMYEYFDSQRHILQEYRNLFEYPKTFG